MGKLLFLGIGLLLALGLAACAAPSTGESGAYHKITGDEAKAMMDEGGVTIVDVRTPAEFAEGHIPGAINLPNEDIGSDRPAELPEQDAVLLLYCRSGRRSREAADRLVALGYTQVYDFGGINDWAYDTVKGE